MGSTRPAAPCAEQVRQQPEAVGRSDWEIPPAGETLIEPSGPELIEVVRAGAQALESQRFQVGGLSAGSLRRAAREAALAIGRSFAERFGLWRGPGGQEPDAAAPRYFVVTGHQPVFAHPGILIKNALVEAVARRLPGAVAINVVVDYDTAPDLSAPAPRREGGRLEAGPVRLMPVGYGRPFCHVPPPSAAQWEVFRRDFQGALASLGQEGDVLLRRFGAFAACARGGSLAAARHLAEWVTALRHRWEQDASGTRACYLEVPMGELAETRPFRLFFAHIALQAGRFATLHNDTLARYRKARGIRSRANPFPDLAVEGARVELPFWLLTQGVRRRALHVERTGSGLLLSTADGPVTHVGLRLPPPGTPADPESVRALVEALGRERLSLRPRAAALTMFLRLFVADLFVHGVGGARYDRVTDALIRSFFGVEPPCYAVASASLTLDLKTPAEAQDEASLRRQLRDLRFNPQRFVSPGAPEALRALAAEKERLVLAIQQPGAPKRQLTRRIEEV
ncbi:MAG: hypothetical protein AB1609_22000, partial [Bacillota bacterium]